MAGTATALTTTGAAQAPRATPAESEIWRRYLEILTLRRQAWAKDIPISNEEAVRKIPLPCSPEECEQILQTMPEMYLAFALAHAGFCGDMEIGNRLIDIHGPIHSELSVQNSQTRLNGEPLHYTWAVNYFRNAGSPAEISKVMEWLPEVGMGWMVGAGSEHSVLFQSKALEHVLKHVRTTQFEGELPHLVSGRVDHPELLLALHERKSGSSFESAFDKILCWVPEGTETHFPNDLVPYKIEQNMHFSDSLKHTREDQSAVIPLADVSKAYLDEVVNLWTNSNDPSLTYDGMRFQDLKLRTTSTLQCIDVDGEMLLSHQANQSIKHGFWERPGMVLCQTTVGFLSNFELGAQEPRNQAASEKFVSNYAPIDLIARNYGSKDEEDALIYIGKIGYVYSADKAVKSFNDLVRHLDGPEPLRSQIKGVLNKDLMSFMTSQRGSTEVNVMSLPILKREYGIDNQGIGVQVWGAHIDALHQTGFRFAADTDTKYCEQARDAMSPLKPSQVAFVTIGMMDMSDQQQQDTHIKALQMGLWATPIKKPESIPEALTALGRRKWNTNTVKGKLPHETNSPVLALRAYVYEAGVEACVREAKTTAHWVTLRTVFGTEVMKPYLKDAPLPAQAKLFTNDLGV